MLIEELVKQALCAKGWTLALAESCTGGAVAARLTRASGASAFFVGGFVVYSNGMKINALGVRAETLEAKGAVSGEVALEMVEGVLKKAGSDLGVAVTGIAGPEGGTQEKPVGTVFVAFARRGGDMHVERWQLQGARNEIIEQVTERVLKTLLESMI